MANKGIEMDFEKLALSKTTHAQRYINDCPSGLNNRMFLRRK